MIFHFENALFQGVCATLMIAGAGARLAVWNAAGSGGRELPPGQMTSLYRIWMITLRSYLLVAGGLVLVRIVQLATGNH